jgi:DDE_Tnp_1-associated
MRAQSAVPAVLSSTAVRTCDLQVQVPDCGRLLELLGQVPDPRKRRGVRHQVASVLAIATAAVLAGSCSVLAVGEWAAEAPQELLAALGARRSRLTGRYVAPHVATFRRLLRITDADAVDAVIGLFLAERTGLGGLACNNAAGDGKAGTGCGVHAGGGRHQPQEPRRQKKRVGYRNRPVEAAHPQRAGLRESNHLMRPPEPNSSSHLDG